MKPGAWLGLELGWGAKTGLCPRVGLGLGLGLGPRRRRGARMLLRYWVLCGTPRDVVCAHTHKRFLVHTGDLLCARSHNGSLMRALRISLVCAHAGDLLCVWLRRFGNCLMRLPPSFILSILGATQRSLITAYHILAAERNGAFSVVDYRLPRFFQMLTTAHPVVSAGH